MTNTTTKLRQTIVRGLVVGKFYPPHAGHSYLIESARAQCNELTVLVCDRMGQTIPASLRAEWLREMFPGVIVKVIDDINEEDNSQIWADYTRQILGYTPDIVFTSEKYGVTWAQCLGCKHIQIDQPRTTVPISATKVRANPLDAWDFLSPAVRAYYSRRICVLGAESTGTTTLARSLAEHYKTAWVPEYGRSYAEGKLKTTGGANWTTDEFIHIASIQNQIEDRLARVCNKILICDTNSFATTLWHERYMGFMSPEVGALVKKRRYDLYIVTGDEIPFEPDGTRDGENIRHAMQQRFIEELERQNMTYLVVTGTREERLQKAVRTIDAYMNGHPDSALAPKEKSRNKEFVPA